LLHQRHHVGSRLRLHDHRGWRNCFDHGKGGLIGRAARPVAEPAETVEVL